jgi:hypothetical protein
MTDPQLPPAVSKTAPDAQHPPTFTFRGAVEPGDITVALHSLSDCVICGGIIPAGSFVTPQPDDDGPGGWAHESCANPGQPARPPLDGRNRT